jgi:hypothetical protein
MSRDSLHLQESDFSEDSEGLERNEDSKVLERKESIEDLLRERVRMENEIFRGQQKSQSRDPPEWQTRVKTKAEVKRRSFAMKTTQPKPFFTPILHPWRRKKLLNLQRMGPPQFKARVPHSHSLKIENGKKV